jgi:hypothetical protein
VPFATASPKPTAAVYPLASDTPTPTILPTLPTLAQPTDSPTPTITPLVPPPPSTAAPSLIEWTPDQANTLIKALEQYPETLQGSYYGYVDAFRYAQLALREALHRFPNSQYSEQWHWDEIFLRMQAGEIGFPEAYAQLIQAAFDHQDTDLKHFPDWFRAHEPRLDSQVIALPSQPGLPDGSLIEISHSNQLAGFYLWAPKTSSSLKVYPISPNRPESFGGEGGLHYDLVDLTGDGHPEWVVLNSYSHGPAFQYVIPTIVDLAQIPPRQLPFLPKAPAFALTYQSQWPCLLQPWKSTGIRLLDAFGSACPEITFELDYQWTGKDFQLAERRFPSIQDLLNK